jgi:segregation and condensation protein B
MRGRRRTPGRPVTFGTTDAFLEHYGLATLPTCRVSARCGRRACWPGPAADFSIPDPNQLWPEEDPLDEGDTPEFHMDFLGDEER